MFNKNTIKIHYPLLTGKYRKEGDRRTLCGEFLRTDHWTNGTKTYHLFTIFPHELNCIKCRSIAKGSGAIRYENACDPFR